MNVAEYKKLMEKTNGGKAAQTEYDLQAACVRLFRVIYPKYANLLFSIPNGAKRTKWERGQALGEGMLPGVPDLFLAIARKGKHGLWIEMKNGSAGKLSDEQKEMIARLEEQGYACVVCRNMDEFMKAIKEYLSDNN